MPCFEGLANRLFWGLGSLLAELGVVDALGGLSPDALPRRAGLGDPGFELGCFSPEVGVPSLEPEGGLIPDTLPLRCLTGVATSED